MVRKTLKLHELTEKDIPTIRDEDDCRVGANSMHEEKLQTQEEEYTVNEMYQQIYQVNKNEMLLAIVFSVFMALSQLAELVLLQLAID